MEIRVLGSGCPKCKRLERTVEQALAATGIEANLAHVTDMDVIMAYPILSTPGLVIDEEVVCSGRLPRQDEVEDWLRASA